MTLRRWSVIVTLAIATWALAPTTTQAQEQPLQAANGAALYLGSLEGIMLAELPLAIALLAGGVDHAMEAVACMALLPLCAVFAPGIANDLGAGILLAVLGVAAMLIVPPIIAGVGGADGWDADGSLILTTGMHGLGAGALVGAAIDEGAGGEGALGLVVGGVLLGAGGTTYAALRHAELTHDPRAGTEANALMWAPPITMLVTAVLMAAGEVDPEIAAFVTGMLGLTAQAITIGLAEAALAEPVPMMMGP